MKAVVVNSEAMGNGDPELGRTLILKFLNSLRRSETKPDVILFYNTGVRVLCQPGAVLEALQDLQASGVELIACGTCVSYFQLQDRILVGRVSNMDEIVATLMKADSVVTI